MFRNCIGMRFALLEAKLAIVKALRVVEIQKCEKTEVSDHFANFINYLSLSMLGSTEARQTGHS